MKKLFYSFLTLAVILAGTVSYLLYTAPRASAACGNGYGFCNQISFNTSKYGSSDTPNFAALFATTTMASLATVGNGGDVQNTVNQSGGSYTSTIPADLVFTTDAGCATNVAGWEFESYNSATGAVNVWVNIGTLSHSNTSVVYMCYGNSSVTTQQMTTTATWNSNYIGVWHMPGGAAGTDSSSNANSISNSGSSDTTGQIDGGENYNAGNQYSGPSGGSHWGSFSSNPRTISGWINWNNINATDNNPNAVFGMIINGENNSGNLSFQRTTSGTLNVNISDGDSIWNTSYSSAISAGTWYYLVATFDGTNTKFYLNGSLVGTTNTSGFNAFIYGGNGQGYFQANNLLSRYESFILDEVRMAQTGFSADQITAEYNNQNSPNTFYTVGATQTGGGGVTNPHSQTIINKAQVIINKGQIIIP